jgi:hypothetical protein
VGDRGVGREVPAAIGEGVWCHVDHAHDQASVRRWQPSVRRRSSGHGRQSTRPPRRP